MFRASVTGYAVGFQSSLIIMTLGSEVEVLHHLTATETSLDSAYQACMASAGVSKFGFVVASRRAKSQS